MSYTTRRHAMQGKGVGRGTSEVIYHQPSQRGGGAPPRMSHPPNTNYSNQQNIQGANSGYGGQPNKPAYSPPSAPPSNTPSQGGYATQASFQSQQPIKVEPPPTPTAAPTPAAPAASPSASPAAATAAAPATAVPAAATSPSAQTPPVTSMDVDADSAADGTAEVKPKPWLKRKISGFKVNKRVKRRRQNARLRKILQPKNAIMVLNELKTGIKFTFQEHTNALTQTMFVVNAEVDGKTYIGQGLSKPLAKQNAAENALKALLLEKMAEAALKVPDSTAEGTEPIQQDVNNGVAANPTPSNASTPDSADGSEVGSEASKTNAPEDDVPWGSLASFALYKLFTEWQSQGTHVPIQKQPTPVVTPNQVRLCPTPVVTPNQPVKASAPAPMKKIPDNPTERHPVMLLNQLKPGVQFTEISREGTTPNLTFTLGVTVDGKSYVGVAKNKKDAKKEAAKSALAGTFNIFYE